MKPDTNLLPGMAVTVEWRDATNEVEGWHARATQIGGLLSVVSVGFVVRRDAECLVICSSWSLAHDQLLDIQSIPWGVIAKLKRIRGLDLEVEREPM